MRCNPERSNQPVQRTRFRMRICTSLLNLSSRYSLVGLLMVLFVISIAFGQSGRQTPPPPKPQPPPQAQGRRPAPTKGDETRPRRADEEAQDEKPLKLKADLV